MIRSFRDEDTRELFITGHNRRGRAIERQALRRLAALESTKFLDDLHTPPSHRLEALKGDRAGQHSIRIHQQYRVCFRWHQGEALDVETVDYH